MRTVREYKEIISSLNLSFKGKTKQQYHDYVSEYMSNNTYLIPYIDSPYLGEASILYEHELVKDVDDSIKREALKEYFKDRRNNDFFLIVDIKKEEIENEIKNILNKPYQTKQLTVNKLDKDRIKVIEDRAQTILNTEYIPKQIQPKKIKQSFIDYFSYKQEEPQEEIYYQPEREEFIPESYQIEAPQYIKSTTQIEEHEYEKALMITPPHDLKAHDKLLRKPIKFDNELKTINEPTNYYWRRVYSLEQVKQDIKNIVKENLRFHNMFKIQIAFGHTVEKYVNNIYQYSHQRANKDYTQKSMKSQVITQVPETLLHYLEYVESLIRSNFEKLHEDSSTRYICITNMVVACLKVEHIQGDIELPNEIKNNKYIVTYPNENNLCWWVCFYCGINNIKTKISKEILSNVKEMIFEYYGVKANPTNFIRDYPGFNIHELNDFLNHYQVNLRKYIYENETFQHQEDIITSKNNRYINVLFYTGLNKNKIPTSHVMYVHNVEKAMGIIFCPNCNSFCLSNRTRDRIHTTREMQKHMKSCNQEKQKEVKLTATKPFLKQLDRQPLFKHLLAHGLIDIRGNNLYTPIQGYITFDFETYEEIINEKITDNTVIISKLHPLSVAMSVKTNTIKSFYYDIRQPDFITLFMKELFNQAKIVKEYNIEQHRHLIQLKQIPDYKKIMKVYDCVKVFGYNSGKFDDNFLFNNLHNKEYRIAKIIGGSTKYKAINVYKRETKDYYIQLVDAMNYTAGGSLENFAKNFGGIDNLKGAFPYESMIDTGKKEYLNVLNSIIPLPKEAFYSSLSNEHIEDKKYNYYLEDMKTMDHWQYLEKYNIQDTQIMIPSIDFIINDNKKFDIDTLNYMSLSAFASANMYISCYDNFDINANYPIDNDITLTYTLDDHRRKVFSYKKQDEVKGRDTTDNITVNDYKTVYNLFKTQCYICQSKFNNTSHKPTLDRIDNSKGHSLNNTKPCCEYCNCYISNLEKEERKLMIQLRRYAIYNNLTFTIDKNHKYVHDTLRKHITGGLSNVLHRVNIKGETKINKFFYDGKKFQNRDTDNIVTHCFGYDANSLYPSSYSSEQHIFNPYGKFLMPGSCTDIINGTQGLDIIKDRSKIFFAVVKGSIPEHRLNEVADFPPIIRNVQIKTNKSTLGNFMYDYMQSINSKTDQEEYKLTNLSKVTEFSCFYCYYLWFLIDHFDFQITDIESVMIFTGHDQFNGFAKTLMSERVEAMLNKNKGVEMMRKISLNGSYGYNILNESHYNKIKLCTANQTLTNHQMENFRSERKLADDLYQVNIESDSYKCETPLHVGFATLDVAKVWYLTFIYDFIYKCVDTEKIHFIEGDTDSMYWAVSGNPDKDYKQGFEYCLKDPEFYYKYKNYFLPDESIEDIKERKLNEKKLLGYCLEKGGDNMVALCPKCYTVWDNEIIIDDKGEAVNKPQLKAKGVSLKQNKNITQEDYLSIVNNGGSITGINTTLQCKGSGYYKLQTFKTALSGVHTKMRVQPNGACLPFY